MKKKAHERPVLFGTDFSPTAREAGEVTALIANRLGTKLLVVHVDDLGPREALAMPYELALEEKREALDRETKRLRKFGPEVGSKLMIGSAFDELVTAAVDSKTQLVAVGAVGHSLPSRLLVGSVAERTAEASPVPTLVVRPNAKLTSWLRGKHSLKILVGYDFSAASDTALQWTNLMQQIGPCEITVLYSNWPPDEARRLGYEGPLPLSANPKEIQKKVERDLAERVATYLPGKNVMTIVEGGWGNPQGYLFQMASRQHVDLIVVGAHQRGAFGRIALGSVSRAILRHTKTSVAVIPPAPCPAQPCTRKIERVLATTDFSELGNNAVSYGCAVLATGGTLKILHVTEPEGSTQRARKSRLRKLAHQLRAIVPTDAEPRATIETEVVESEKTGEAIAQAAERFGADLICIGSHGRTGLAKTFLGSVAQTVMKTSKRPVLVVRQQS